MSNEVFVASRMTPEFCAAPAERFTVHLSNGAWPALFDEQRARVMALVTNGIRGAEKALLDLFPNVQVIASLGSASTPSTSTSCARGPRGHQHAERRGGRRRRSCHGLAHRSLAPGHRRRPLRARRKVEQRTVFASAFGHRASGSALWGWVPSETALAKAGRSIQDAGPIGRAAAEAASAVRIRARPRAARTRVGCAGDRLQRRRPHPTPDRRAHHRRAGSVGRARERGARLGHRHRGADGCAARRSTELGCAGRARGATEGLHRSCSRFPMCC